MTDSVLQAFLRGFTKRAEAPKPAQGPVPQAKGKPAVAEPAGAPDKPMGKAQRAIAELIKKKASKA
jgi:hypothetical protein